jgi:hypothetical protein
MKITDATLKQEALWGAKAIATFLGTTVDRVYRWAEDPTVPIHKRGGTYFALKSELWAWLRSENPEAA